MIIHVIGARGSGRTTLATTLADKLNAVFLCSGYGEEWREKTISTAKYAKVFEELGEIVIVDIKPPTREAREIFDKPDITICLNTAEELGEFEIPDEYDYCFDSNFEDPEAKANLIIEENSLL